MTKTVTIAQVHREAREGDAQAVVRNKGGRPPRLPTDAFADPGPRGRVLVEKYGGAQIIAWYRLIQAERAEEVPLSTGDMLLIGRIARGMRDGAELDKLYDRSFGKVPDRSINLNINAGVDPEKLSEQAAEMLARLGE